MDIKIKPDTKNVICRALRSSGYRQGREFWADDGSRCVGGVIVEVYRQMHTIRGSVSLIVSPLHFLAWMGLTDHQASRFADETEVMNETMTFPEIADVIEANY